MMSLNSLQELAKKYQTDFKNVAREYIEHQFLFFCYQHPQAEQLLFKGGTALRIIYGSPRFSEDLDFTGINISSYRLIEDVFIETIQKLEKLGVAVNLTEAKPTSGGYLGKISYQLYNFLEEQIKFEVSLRGGKDFKKDINIIVSDYLPAYSIIHLSGEQIVKGKIAALSSRQKPRDYYDLYFILRHPELHKYVTKDNFQQIRKMLLQTEINFKKELSVLLPQNHQIILKNFNVTLSREIKKYL